MNNNLAANGLTWPAAEQLEPEAFLVVSYPAEVCRHAQSHEARRFQPAKPVGPHRVNLVVLVVGIEAGHRAVVVAAVLKKKNRTKCGLIFNLYFLT